MLNNFNIFLLMCMKNTVNNSQMNITKRSREDGKVLYNSQHYTCEKLELYFTVWWHVQTMMMLWEVYYTM